MKPQSWILPAAAMAALGGCVVVNGPTETRSFTNSGFDSITAGSGINVVVKQGPFSVSAVAPEGNLDRITVEQDGHELKLGRKSEISWFGWNGYYVVNVSAPAIVKIETSGGADVEASGLQGAALTLSASGGGDIDITGLKIAALSLSASGGGDINAAGACETATIRTSGGGDVNGEDLACANVTADASSGGDVEIQASMVANGTASSGGDVRFIGAPTTFNKTESSGGDVTVEGR